jgi:hypothetical protein
MGGLVRHGKVVAKKKTFSALPSAQNESEIKKKKTKRYLILSHVNHTFLILNPEIEPPSL